ncbi:MFS transporter [Nonomuraea sp. NPDC049400]|uniref:MFS transporter n=1 Tax=Nonomuraea sp. NPDC049400 TaxID=3364352 RepID=UPI0037A274BB
MDPHSPTLTQQVRPGLVLAAILLIAANLRALVAAVGPALPIIAADTGLSATAQGVLVALPVAAFAVFSPMTAAVAVRRGTERMLLFALIVLAAGAVLRSLPVPAADLWPVFIGTAAIGGAMAVGNVLLPVLTHKAFPSRVSVVTGHYIAVQSVVAALASMLTVPLVLWLGSWRLAIGLWGLFVLAALVTWRPRMGVAPQPAPSDPSVSPPTVERPSVWRTPLAWQVATYFGLQSSAFYILLSWLPSVEQDIGVSAEAAGEHLGVFLLTGIAATQVVPMFLRGQDQRAVAMIPPLGVLLAMVGLVLVPSLVVLWAALAGFGLSCAMVTSLSLISLRAGHAELTGRLSSMVQGAAYTMVAVALVAAGFVREVIGPGRHVTALVAAAAVGLTVLGGWVGRDRTLA